MATTRKRSNPTGFESQGEETPVNEFLEEALKEDLEEVEKQEQMPAVLHIAEPDPEPDPEPEIELPPKPAPVAIKPTPSLSPPPKRHPRNIPKFSSHK